MISETSISVAGFNTFALSDVQAHSAWKKEIADAYEILDLKNASGETSRARVAGVSFCGLSAISFQFQSNSIQRTAALARRNYSPVLYVRKMISGYQKISSDTINCVCNPGYLHFWNFNEPKSISSSDHVGYTLAIPYKMVGYEPGKSLSYFKIDLNTPVAGALDFTISSALKGFDNLDSFEWKNCASTIRDLVVSAVRNCVTLNPEDLSPYSRFSLLTNFIEINLSNKDLDVDLIVDKFGISRATLYRQFNELGGVKSYINNRRMDQAMKFLKSSNRSKVRVSECAELFGFASASLFSNIFNEKFGVRPSHLIHPEDHEHLHHFENVSLPGLGDETRSEDISRAGFYRRFMNEKDNLQNPAR